MIHTTLGALVAAESALSELAKLAATAEPRWAARTVYVIGRLCATVPEHVALFHQQRQALLAELGTAERPATPPEKQSTGQDVVDAVLPEKHDEFMVRLREIMAVPVELPVPQIAVQWLDGIKADDPVGLFVRLGSLIGDQA